MGNLQRAALGLVVCVCTSGCPQDIVVAMGVDGAFTARDGTLDAAERDQFPGAEGPGSSCETCSDALLPVCDEASGRCRGCVANTECASRLCALDGSCPQAEQIAHVDDDCSTTGDGSATNPFCTVGEGIASSRRYIRVAEGVYPEAVDLGSNQQLYGESQAATLGIPGDGECRSLRVLTGETADVVVMGFTLRGQVLVQADATATLVDNVIGPSECVGILARPGSAITLRRNLIWQNLGGGAEFDQVSAYEVINNYVVENGSATTDFGGVQLRPQGARAVFVNNTVANNVANVDDPDDAAAIICRSGALVVNSIIWNNDKNPDGEQSFGCTFSHSAVETTAPPTGPGNIIADPQFAGIGTGVARYRLTGASPCRDVAAQTGDTPLDDFDREPRGDSPDIGADEFL